MLCFYLFPAISSAEECRSVSDCNHVTCPELNYELECHFTQCTCTQGNDISYDKMLREYILLIVNTHDVIQQMQYIYIFIPIPISNLIIPLSFLILYQLPNLHYK